MDDIEDDFLEEERTHRELIKSPVNLQEWTDDKGNVPIKSYINLLFMLLSVI